MDAPDSTFSSKPLVISGSSLEISPPTQTLTPTALLLFIHYSQAHSEIRIDICKPHEHNHERQHL
jgi:hypothetical protein